MRDVAIIGAGELGGAIAHLLARADIATTVWLVDEAGQIAAGKALDIMQSSPIHGFATQVTGANDLFAAAGASVIVIADRADHAEGGGASAGAEWHGEDGLALLSRLAHVGSDRVMVCAGAAQRELVERGCRELMFSRTRLFGSAPEALAAALRAFVALEANGSSKDVALSVLGIPPAQVVVPWGDATIGGVALTRVLDAPAARRLASRVAPLWPPGPYALAAAALKTIDAIIGNSRQLVSCFVAPDDGNGRRARAVALPARLGPSGVVAADVPPLSVHDRVALDNAMLL